MDTETLSSGSETWQHLDAFKDTNIHMLDDQILCDVTVVAGDAQEEIKCHKFVLASRSSVFYTMFCGSLPETSGIITIPDIEADAVKKFIRFLYTGECEINPDTVMALMYAAKKYDVVLLKHRLTAYLKENMKVDDVCTILEQANLFGEVDLEKQCLVFISKNTTQLLMSDTFLSVSKDVLKSILELDLVDCKEEVLYKYCKSWAMESCSRSGILSDDSNVRDELGKLLFYIRFPSLPLETFMKLSEFDKVLTFEEKFAITQDIVLKRNVTNFKGAPRILSRTGVKFERFKTILSDSWNHRGGLQDGISFTVSKQSYLTAIALYLPTDGGNTNGPLEIFQGRTQILTQKINLQNIYGSQYKYVTLSDPVFLIPGEIYSIRHRFEGSGTYSGTSGIPRMRMKTPDFEINFMDLTEGKSSNGTCLCRGQIHGVKIGVENAF